MSNASLIAVPAIRFAWLMDPHVSSAKRLLRGAVALHTAPRNGPKGVRALPAERFDPDSYQQMVNGCSRERTTSAG